MTLMLCASFKQLTTSFDLIWLISNTFTASKENYNQNECVTFELHFNLIPTESEKVSFKLKLCFTNKSSSHSRIFHNFQMSHAFWVTIMINILNCFAAIWNSFDNLSRNFTHSWCYLCHVLLTHDVIYVFSLS